MRVAGTVAASLAAGLLAVAMAAGPAQAAFTGCAYDPYTREVVATTDTSSPGTLSVGSGGEILADGAPCGVATVTNTDTIRTATAFTGGDRFRIVLDLAGGPFAPGATDEPGFSDEIEFAIDLAGTFLSRIEIAGSAGADHVVAGTSGFPVGASGINLNADEPVDDLDVALVMDFPIAEIPYVELRGRAGGDVLSLAGGEGTGGYYTAGSGGVIDGGGGNDVLRAGEEDMILRGRGGDDILVAGPDDDGYFLDGGRGRDILTGLAGDDVLRGGAGNDLLRGGSGDDRLLGGRNNDRLIAGAGRDFLDGGAGRDLLDGGPGRDRCRRGEIVRRCP